MDYMSIQSLPAMFLEQAAAQAEKNFLWSKHEGVYRPITWDAAAQAVKDLSRGLRALGLEPGERVMLLSENRPEWLIADIAIMAAGGITVPAYATNTVADNNHVLTHSGARGAIVSTRALAERLLPAALEAPDCEWVISIEELDPGQSGPGQSGPTAFHTWAGIEARGAAQSDDVAEFVARATRGDTACFIYTSGTGGVPKGVILSHGAILCNCMGSYHLLEKLGLGDDVFLSFLPLSHSYEHTAGQFFPISIGAEIYYGAGIDQLLTNLAEVRPTIMTAVPRLYETMYQRILRGVEKQGGLKARLFHLALDLGRKRYADPASLNPWERVLDRLTDRLVRDKIRARFGGRLKAMVSGGAALNPDIGIFFDALGLCVLQGYGQTEAAPVISANPPGRIKMHTVGPPLEGVEVRIAEDGEILVRGELLMDGYWRNEAASAEALKDGWLHTGDLATVDGEGYYRITGRLKDMIIRGGENVYPREIEEFLYTHPKIADVQVIGVPDERFVEEVMAWVVLKPGETADAEEIRDFCKGKIAHYKIPRYIKMASEFPMTVTGKIQKFRMREMAIEELGLHNAANIETA